MVAQIDQILPRRRKRAGFVTMSVAEYRAAVEAEKKEGKDWEAEILEDILDAGLPAPEPQWRFMPRRRYRFDFAYPALGLAIEVEGAVWVQGRHTRGQGYEDDCVKYNLAALLGWKVLRVTSNMIDDGRAIAIITKAYRQLTAPTPFTHTGPRWPDGGAA